MNNNTKMDTSEVFAMFETINSKLDKQPNKPVEPTQVDMTAIESLTERLEDAIKEVKKPTQVEHRHHHKIDICSNWFFLSWVALVIIILALFWAIANQWQTISQYKDNDLKYRYIRMYGQTDEENLYRLERQFKYSDSIKIIRKQVERYEELVREKAAKLERAKQSSEEVDKLQKEAELLKKKQ